MGDNAIKADNEFQAKRDRAQALMASWDQPSQAPVRDGRKAQS